jgi:hypothetical protein
MAMQARLIFMFTTFKQGLVDGPISPEQRQVLTGRKLNWTHKAKRVSPCES